ncbi:hypothetical protein ACWDRB_13220 [Nonomuraea sp. NPDC003707]
MRPNTGARRSQRRPDIPALFAERQRTGHSPAETVTALWRDLTTGGEQKPRTRLLLEVLAFAVAGPGFTHCSQAERYSGAAGVSFDRG